MARGSVIYIKDKDGEMKSLKSLAKSHSVPYATVQCRYSRGIRGWKKLTTDQLKKIIVDGRKMSVAAAAKYLEINRTTVDDRWSKFCKGIITEEELNHIGQRKVQKVFENGPPGNDEWNLLGKNLRNGDGFQQSITLRRIPNGSSDGCIR